MEGDYSDDEELLNAGLRPLGKKPSRIEPFVGDVKIIPSSSCPVRPVDCTPAKLASRSTTTVFIGTPSGIIYVSSGDTPARPQFHEKGGDEPTGDAFHPSSSIGGPRPAGPAGKGQNTYGNVISLLDSDDDSCDLQLVGSANPIHRGASDKSTAPPKPATGSSSQGAPSSSGSSPTPAGPRANTTGCMSTENGASSSGVLHMPLPPRPSRADVCPSQPSFADASEKSYPLDTLGRARKCSPLHGDDCSGGDDEEEEDDKDGMGRHGGGSMDRDADVLDVQMSRDWSPPPYPPSPLSPGEGCEELPGGTGPTNHKLPVTVRTPSKLAVVGRTDDNVPGGREPISVLSSPSASPASSPSRSLSPLHPPLVPSSRDTISQRRLRPLVRPDDDDDDADDGHDPDDDGNDGMTASGGDWNLGVPVSGAVARDGCARDPSGIDGQKAVSDTHQSLAGRGGMEGAAGRFVTLSCEFGEDDDHDDDDEDGDGIGGRFKSLLHRNAAPGGAFTAGGSSTGPTSNYSDTVYARKGGNGTAHAAPVASQYGACNTSGVPIVEGAGNSSAGGQAAVKRRKLGDDKAAAKEAAKEAAREAKEVAKKEKAEAKAREKERKAKEAEERREALRKSREAAKADKEREKENRGAERELRRRLGGRDAAQDLTILLDAAVLAKEKIGCELLRTLDETEYPREVRQNKLPGTIEWHRRRTLPDGSVIQERVAHVAFLYSGEEFGRVLYGREPALDACVRRAVEAYPGHVISLVVSGLVPYLRSCKQKEWKAGGTGGSAPDIDAMLAHLTVAHGAAKVKHFLALDAADAADHVVQLAKCMAQAPYRTDMKFLKVFGSAHASTSRVVEHQDGQCGSWAAMLNTIQGSGDRSARAIAKAFPSLRHLMDAYAALPDDALRNRHHRRPRRGRGTRGSLRIAHRKETAHPGHIASVRAAR
eukprot:jgi/Mesvir1/25556/Mv01793-RA.2